jgi:arylsulfatase A-like enzyme
MTGHRPVRNGAWSTTFGRAMLRRDEVTIADVFSGNGYRTGIFGKWHLGHSYPYRPQDRGFETAIWHKGGGIGQLPDHWGNNYFDDTYFRGGEPYTYDGYCTDIWFEEALGFIEASRDEPFFAYIATNAPHDPFLVPESYAAPYRDNPEIVHPAFYGMITNIDENFGRLCRRLKELGIEDNTILVFMTDNGTFGGCTTGEEEFIARGFNAGMRGRKGSYYEGGHRAPCFVRWPAGGIDGGRDVEEMTMHVDVLPTVIDLCGLSAPEGVSFDGISLASLLRGEADALAEDRLHFVQYRLSTAPPEKWENAVLNGQWRLVRGKELYDIKADPGQRHNVAEEHPDVVARLRDAHEAWWEEVEPQLEPYCPISLGADEENPTRLDAFDLVGRIAWTQGNVVMAQPCGGEWAVAFEQPGTYSFRLQRWPEEVGLPIQAACSQEMADSICPIRPVTRRGTIDPEQARLRLFGRDVVCSVEEGSAAATFEMEVEQTGETRLEAWWVDPDGAEYGVYYVYVERTT